MNKNRDKGHRFEREIMRFYKALGFDKCITSRYSSKQKDDAGIDLDNLPINVQCKSGYSAKSKWYRGLIDKILEFDKSRYVVIHHTVDRRKYGKSGDLVILPKELYNKILQAVPRKKLEEVLKKNE